MKNKLDVIDVNGRHNVNEAELVLEKKRKRRQQQRRKKLEAKRRRRRCLIKLTAAIVSAGILFGSVGPLYQYLEKQGIIAGNEDAADVIADNAKSNSMLDEFLYEVEYADFFTKYKPQQMEETEVYARLRELAKDYKELEDIYKARESYPVKLLAALCNNPEMQGYVKGYLAYENGDSSVAEKAELTKEEKRQSYPLFLQWDKRWGYEAYGDFNIALSGCGPTTLAMAAVTLTDDNTITPNRVADYSMKNGYYVEGTGTAWSLMTDGCKNFGIKSSEIALDEFVMKNQLRDGKVIICSMGPGDFTSAGHFIMIYGYDDSGFFVNDPNCIYRSSRTWSYDTIKNQIRILWAFEEK